MNKNIIKLLLGFLLMLSSCEDLIEYSPYQTLVKDSYKNQNAKNLSIIENINQKEFKSFKIAVISDPHTAYDDFVDEVNSVNKQDSIDFVVCAGDLTLSAIYREFVWYSDIIAKLNKPIITLIGNHDYLSNGGDMYKEMFGNPNFYFVYKNCKFVIFDDVIWEKDVSDPDFDWFSEKIQNDSNYTHVIPFSHIPPWDEQFSYGNEKVYNYLLENAGIKLSVHGHTHRYSLTTPYNNSVKYLTVENSEGRSYVILNVKKDTIEVNRIKF